MAILEMRKRLRHLAGLEESMRRDAAKLEALQSRMSHQTVAKDLEAYLKARHVDCVDVEDDQESLQESPLDSMAKHLHDRHVPSQSRDRNPRQEHSSGRSYASRAMRLVDVETGDGMAFPVWGIPDSEWQPEFSVSTKGGLLADDIVPDLPPSKEVSTLAARYESAISALRKAIDTPKAPRSQAEENQTSKQQQSKVPPQLRQHDQACQRSGLLRAFQYEHLWQPSMQQSSTQEVDWIEEMTSYSVHVEQPQERQEELLPPEREEAQSEEACEMRSEDGHASEPEEAKPVPSAEVPEDVWRHTYSAYTEFARRTVEAASAELEAPQQGSREVCSDLPAFETAPAIEEEEEEEEEEHQAFDDELLHSATTPPAPPPAVATTMRALMTYDEVEGGAAPLSNLAAAVKGENARQRERLSFNSERYAAYADAKLVAQDEAAIISPRGVAQPLAASMRSQQSVETVVFPRRATETTPLELISVSPILSSRPCGVEGHHRASIKQACTAAAHIGCRPETSPAPSPVPLAASDEGSVRRQNILNRLPPKEPEVFSAERRASCLLQQQMIADPEMTLTLLPSRPSPALAPCVGGVAPFTVAGTAYAAPATAQENHQARLSALPMLADAGTAAYPVPWGPTPSATVTTMTATPAEPYCLSPAPSQQNSRGSSSIVIAASEVISRGGDVPLSGASGTPSVLHASQASSLQQSYLVSARLFVDENEGSEPPKKMQVAPLRRASSTSRQVEFAESIDKESIASAGSFLALHQQFLPPTPSSQPHFTASAWLESSRDAISSHAWDSGIAESSHIAPISDASNRTRSSKWFDLALRPKEATRSPGIQRSRSLGGSKRMTINVSFR
mmetsp:Transcript_3203/g.7198  ORF Transcript_3203/g.7198 Transcript_3203/m.7198 type:complete len:851 (+) Transcript_3203:44-2596(+)